MLSLWRRTEEEIVIGDKPDQIVVKVIEIRPNGQVRMTIDAPRHIEVWRKEIFLARQNKKGA